MSSFLRDGDLLVPQRGAQSVWSDDMINGRHICGLVAWAAERDHHDAALQPTRLTVDLFSAVPMAPVELVTTEVRAGRRIKVIDVSLRAGGREVTRASVELLKRDEHPDSGLAPLERWDAPSPEETSTAGPSPMSWEVRNITPWDAPSSVRRRVWMRESEPFLTGEPTSPFVRLAMDADFANPLANRGTGGLAFINTDITLYAVRLPEDEWVGMEVVGHLGADNIAVGTVTMHDRIGPLGFATASGLADQRLANRMRASAATATDAQTGSAPSSTPK